MFKQEAGDSYTKADLEKFFEDFKRLVILLLSSLFHHPHGIISKSEKTWQLYNDQPPSWIKEKDTSTDFNKHQVMQEKHISLAFVTVCLYAVSLWTMSL